GRVAGGPALVGPGTGPVCDADHGMVANGARTAMAARQPGYARASRWLADRLVPAGADAADRPGDRSESLALPDRRLDRDPSARPTGSRLAAPRGTALRRGH